MQQKRVIFYQYFGSISKNFGQLPRCQIKSHPGGDQYSKGGGDQHSEGGGDQYSQGGGDQYCQGGGDQYSQGGGDLYPGVL